MLFFVILNVLNFHGLMKIHIKNISYTLFW
jgi:hypothetical protein